MIITTQGRYALRLMLDLAEHQGEGYISLTEISKRQNFSKKYLEQIIMSMHHEGMLNAVRGHYGGYRLAREPKDYTLWEILSVTEKHLDTVACLTGGKTDCPTQNRCATVLVWKSLYDVIRNHLSAITLQDVLNDKLRLEELAAGPIKEGEPRPEGLLNGCP